jgi:hypothetical protein
MRYILDKQIKAIKSTLLLPAYALVACIGFFILISCDGSAIEKVKKSFSAELRYTPGYATYIALLQTNDGENLLDSRVLGTVSNDCDLSAEVSIDSKATYANIFLFLNRDDLAPTFFISTRLDSPNPTIYGNYWIYYYDYIYKNNVEYGVSPRMVLDFPSDTEMTLNFSYRPYFLLHPDFMSDSKNNYLCISHINEQGASKIYPETSLSDLVDPFNSSIISFDLSIHSSPFIADIMNHDFWLLVRPSSYAEETTLRISFTNMNDRCLPYGQWVSMDDGATVYYISLVSNDYDYIINKWVTKTNIITPAASFSSDLQLGTSGSDLCIVSGTKIYKLSPSDQEPVEILSSQHAINGYYSIDDTHSLLVTGDTYFNQQIRLLDLSSNSITDEVILNYPIEGRGAYSPKNGKFYYFVSNADYCMELSAISIDLENNTLGEMEATLFPSDNPNYSILMPGSTSYFFHSNGKVTDISGQVPVDTGIYLKVKIAGIMDTEDGLLSLEMDGSVAEGSTLCIRSKASPYSIEKTLATWPNTEPLALFTDGETAVAVLSDYSLMNAATICRVALSSSPSSMCIKPAAQHTYGLPDSNSTLLKYVPMGSMK